MAADTPQRSEPCTCDNQDRYLCQHAPRDRDMRECLCFCHDEVRASPSAGEPTREQVEQALREAWSTESYIIDLRQETCTAMVDAIQALYRRQSNNGET